jgi:nondiscriminating glutamyl-tRNA synthetase
LNWLFTQQAGGQCILRIEDTDRVRNVEGAERQIAEDLLWLGLSWNEGPFYQTERLPIYQEYAQQLLERGHLYHCYCLQEELDAARDAAIERGEQAQYPGTCRNATPEQIAEWQRHGREAALRFKVPAAEDVVVRDVVYGDVQVKSDEISDFIVLRSDGLPTYNFAVVVDDIVMKVSHVIRGVGHLSNTPRQVLLFQAFGEEPPVFAHIPMVLGPDRQKLSKRHGAQALAEYRAEGYHPDGLLNYLSLLGWSSPTGEEVLTREQLVEQISLDRIGNADVVFDPVKLSWLSAKHIERMPLNLLVKAVEPFVDPARFPLSEELLHVAVAATRSHLNKFSDVNEQLAAFFPDGAAPQPSTEGRTIIATAHSRLSETALWDEPTLAAVIKTVGKETGAKGKALYEPLRITLTGHEHGPPLPAVLVVQGRERVLERLAAAGQA